MTNEIKNVPELRFKNESGKTYPDWEKRKLNEIADFQNGKAHESYVSETGNYILVNSKFISTEAQVKKYVSQQLTPLNKQDIAIVMSDIPNGKALAKCFLVEESNKYSLNQRIGRLYNILGDSRLVYAILNRNKQLLKYDSGVGQTNLKKSEIIEIIINWPVQDEQQKIGDFFSKLDQQIELEEKKLAKLEEQKKGYMQKIFSQELRFKDENGNDYPEWEIKKLMQIAKVKTGSKNVQDNIQDGKYKFFDRSVEVKYLNTFDFDETAIIYPGEGSKFLPRYFSGKYSLHQRAYSIYDININNNYLYYYLSLQNNHFLKYAVGSTVKSLRMSGFDKLKVMVPKNSEQEKIGSFFKNLDEFIEKQANKVELLKQRKQSFLQKMFV